jgi:YspA, cpYpsA-related SLOG family
MRILVCGGRTYDDRDLVWRTLDDYQHRHGSITVIQGGAPGADALAKEWWYKRPQKGTLISVPTAWEELSHADAASRTRADGSRYDAAAGGRRNAEMLDEKPDLVLAFPGNKGTRDMLRRTEEAKKKGMVIEIRKVGW